MVFSELYSVYYTAVARILGLAVTGELTDRAAREIIAEHAFSESALSILPSLKEEKWQLLHRDMTTPLEHAPTVPLTLLEKRWLKAVLLDERVKLFDVHFDGLDGVTPLFTPDDIRVYDKYSDGDSYSDPDYIARFRIILDALRGGYPITAETLSRDGAVTRASGVPKQLEYSEKDDKFRVILSGGYRMITVNLGRIVSVKPYRGDNFNGRSEYVPEAHHVTLLITDTRNAMERMMLHFAHFEKQAERIDSTHYRLRLCYSADDETELVIRVLSFGPVVKVEEPQDFVGLVRDRLRRQLELGLK